MQDVGALTGGKLSDEHPECAVLLGEAGCHIRELWWVGSWVLGGKTWQELLSDNVALKMVRTQRTEESNMDVLY